MRVLVTGGSGFLGTNLVEHYLAAGAQVVNLDLVTPRNQEHRQFWTRCDLRDAVDLASNIRAFSPTLILHMGARTDLLGTAVEQYSANTEGVGNLIDAVVGLEGLERIIFASSRLVCRIGYQPANDAEYCPTTAYGESKVRGELLVRESASRLPCPWCIVRPTSIWGPWFDIPYKTFFLMISRGLYVHPKGQRVEKSFGFVGNTVYQLDRLAAAPADAICGRMFYLADYPPIEVLEMAQKIQAALGARSINQIDHRILRLAARIGDAMQTLGWKNPPLTSFRLDNLVTPMVHDLRPLERIVGPLSYSMDAGVGTTVAWLRQQGQVPPG
jgi:GlcNAc-P-P-Und epimerase